METVTHPADGEVWAPFTTLAELSQLARDIDAFASHDVNGIRGDTYTARTLHHYATRLRIAIGEPVVPFNAG